jgi:hypothetical protein
MKNIVQVALIGGAAYLAIDYLNKRKANQKKTSTLVAASNKNVIDAEMQEEGEEGYALKVAQDQQLGAAVPEDKFWNARGGSLTRAGFNLCTCNGVTYRVGMSCAQFAQQCEAQGSKFSGVDGWNDSTPISFGM